MKKTLKILFKFFRRKTYRRFWKPLLENFISEATCVNVEMDSIYIGFIKDKKKGIIF